MAREDRRQRRVVLAALALQLVDDRLDVTRHHEHVARWSLRVKLDRKGDDRVSFSHVTFYQPVVDDVSRYLVISTSQAAYSLTTALAVTLSLSERFDSEARGRGARSNHDGALLVGFALSR